MESIFSEIRQWLDNEDDSQIIGIYGMGGIGKTTLLKAINNELLHVESLRFDLVIFIAVSKEVNIDRIQKEIGERLGYGSEFSDKDIRGRATRLLNVLSRKKFILLLDDLWTKLDLGEVGVPFSSISRKGSKVAFTTRSAKVCNDMGAADRKVKVPFLTEERSWELFCKSMGKLENDMRESVIPLAKAIANKCGGLPLAIIIVGRAMADVSTRCEWEEALRALPQVVEGMKDEVLTTLKFSFDKLKDESHKECLLYCSLFPEDHDIEVSRLVEYWVGEGFFEKGSYPLSLDSARNRGYVAISALKAACLLEDGEWEDSAKLHDVVREMALWITSPNYEKYKPIFLVNCSEGLDCVLMPTRWTDATRISLVRNRISEVPEVPKCENLRTLFLENNHLLRQIHSQFFRFTPFLTVLDLSSTAIEILPHEIGSLAELRFLSLSRTPLKSLPEEVGKLTKLKILDLSVTYDLQSIPKEAISRLPCLLSLKVSLTSYSRNGGWKDLDVNCMDRGIRYKDLNDLKQLEELDLGISIQSLEDWRGLSDSPKLCQVMRFLYISEIESISSINLSGDLGTPKDLRHIFITNCPRLNQLIFPAFQIMKLEVLSLENVPLKRPTWSNVNALIREPSKGGACFQNLTALIIEDCNKMKEITWIRELPCLEILQMRRCAEMLEIIEKEESERDTFFPRLYEMTLEEMGNLKRISKKALLFPCLQRVTVAHSPKLKKLPFGHLSAKNIKRIAGEYEWWNALEWSDPSIRQNFTSYFEPIGESDYLTH